MEKHDWKLDGIIENGLSDCFRCKICGLAQLIYENEKYFINLKSIELIKCNKDNRGVYIASRNLEDSEEKFTIV